MKKNLKVLVSVICLMLAMATSVVYVGAAQIGGGETAEPMWENTSSIRTTLAYIDDMGQANALCIGDMDVSCIKIDAYVFRQLGSRWIYVTQSHITAYDWIAGINFTFEADIRATFRADFIFTVTKNGVDEVIPCTVYEAF